MKTRARSVAASFLAVLAALVAGAAGCRAPAHSRVGYYLAPGQALASVERVALLPLANHTDVEGLDVGLTEELIRAIQGRRLFHVAVAPGPAGPDGAEPSLAVKPLTLEELAAIRRALRADAVLMGSVHRWQPPPRMQLSLYLRLLDLRSGEVLWAVDHAWDATAEHTQRRLRLFFEREMGGGAEPYEWELATVSPRTFQKFVAWEVAGTLPRRPRQPDSGTAVTRAAANFRKNPGI